MKVLKVGTIKLQEMVSKAVKGASCNKLIPITGLMAIELANRTLTLTTTDASNTLKVIEQNIEGEDFYIVVQADVFSKLVAKTTSESITIKLKENSLEVKGNGTYNIDLPLDEEGNLIKFPDYKFDAAKCEKGEIQLSTVKAILGANKVALAETMEVPCLTGYYMGEGVVTTDSFKVCKTAIKVSKNPMLLTAEMVNLLSIISDEKIKFQKSGKKLLFTTPSVVVYGTELDGIEDYPIEAIENYVSSEFGSMCKVSKAALISVLDRLMLFVSTYDKNGVYLTVTKDGLVCSSKKSTGKELIPFQGSTNFKAYTCCIDIQLLYTQVAAQASEVVELWYGHDSAIKMVSGNITQLVALLEDDRIEEDGESES